MVSCSPTIGFWPIREDANLTFSSVRPHCPRYLEHMPTPSDREFFEDPNASDLVDDLLNDGHDMEAILRAARVERKAAFDLIVHNRSRLHQIWLSGAYYVYSLRPPALIPKDPGGPAYVFKSTRDLLDMIDYLTGSEPADDIDAIQHTYSGFKQQAREVPAEEKEQHVVFRHGPYIFLKLPGSDPSFVQREGQDMEHCLAVAHEDYCRRIRAGEIDVYSMTDTRDNKPKVDIEVALKKPSYNKAVPAPTVTQIRGPRNLVPPEDKYLEALVGFFEEYGKPRGWRVNGHGVVNFDGKVDGDLLVRRWNQIQQQ